MRKKTGAGLLLFSISLLFSCAGSCAVDRDETVRRSVAEAELRLIMFQIESRVMHLDALSDPEYIAIALKVCALIDMLCDILSARLTMKSKCDKVSRKKEN